MDNRRGAPPIPGTVPAVDLDELLRAGPALFAAAGLAAVTPALVRVDLAEHRLPNRLVGFAAAALAPALAWRWLLEGAFPSGPLLAGAVAGLAYLVLAIGGGMGMGDVKLAAVLGCGAALASPVAAVAGLMLAFLLGGLAAAAVLARRGLGRLRSAPAIDGEAAASAPSGGAGLDAAEAARIAFGPWMLLGHWLALALALAASLS